MGNISTGEISFLGPMGRKLFNSNPILLNFSVVRAVLVESKTCNKPFCITNINPFSVLIIIASLAE